MRDAPAPILRLIFCVALMLEGTAKAGEIPRRSEEFVDSIGINAHIDVAATVYNEAVIGQVGIKHLRSNVKPDQTTLQSRLNRLYADYGCLVDLTCDATSYTPVQIRDFAQQPIFEAVEGLNEPDAAGPRSYAGLTDDLTLHNYAATMLYQSDLCNAMRANSATAAKPLLSPAMANPANSGYLQNIAADFIAMHSYPAQQMPTGNFLASYAIPNAETMAGTASMRLIASETGYRSGGGWGDISAAAATKYVPRLFAEYFRLGVTRAYLFEMIDNASYDYGLADINFTPKPAYYALQRLIALVRESSWNASTAQWNSPAAFYPTSLDYSLSTASSNVHHLLLQKSTGKFYLVVWQEVPSFDLTQGTDIANPTVPVDVTFNTGIATASVYRLNATSAQATYSAVSALHLDVPDELMIVELTPGPTAPIATVTGPVASIATTAANTSMSPLQTGAMTVTRTGDLSSALTVNYTASGTAAAGVDFVALPGAVTIPAGAAAATITVTPCNPAIVGRKSLTLTLANSSAYGISNARSASVYFGSTNNLLYDFNSGTAPWQGSTYSTVSPSPNADTGAGAMEVSMSVNGTDRWQYSWSVPFAAAQDWSAATKLVLRIKESPANSAADLGQPIYFTWFNHGVDVGSGYGAAKFPLTLDPNYRTVTIDLGNFPRDQVTGLYFYVDGATLQPGVHTLDFDNLMAVSDTNGVLADFEELGVTNWTHGGMSTPQLETTSVDTGLQALRWTFTANGTPWDNYVKLDFPLPTDLSRFSTLRIRFKEDAANPASDVGQTIFVDWFNHEVRPNGDGGVAAFPIASPAGYRTVEINIANVSRDAVSSLFFYVNGAAFAPGPHVWYLDNISVY